MHLPTSARLVIATVINLWHDRPLIVQSKADDYD